MNGGRTIGLLAATHVAALGVGYMAAPKLPVDAEAKHTGLFTLDTNKVLATTVESLREENRLLVFSYKGTAKVQAGRTVLWLFGGEQELIVPAVVTYHLDLSDLSLADVRYDEKAKLVTVKLPKVTLGDIAFQPENATTINGGVLTFSDDQVEALRKANYANARRAIIAQAQQPGLLNAAKRQARTNVENYFAIPLRIAGLPDVKVAATF
ncbi:DUF4230 domain-containing protein [Sphingopyxis sp. J-6]|uniref:DUF4230 domain-containing protein n=1 Tax=Sphingopyxis sp. J-6 TaxID=3122054 RepID=UPI003984050F